MLDDGTYDAFIVDVTIDAGAGPDGRDVHHLELTITAGQHKGEVLTVSAVGMRGSEFDLIGMPATLTVEGGAPRVRLG